MSTTNDLNTRSSGRHREWALHVPSERSLDAIAEIVRRDRDGTLSGFPIGDPAAAQVVAATLPRLLKAKSAPAQRVYWGTEFCEHLTPHPDRLRRVVDLLSALGGLGLTLLTPWVSDLGAEKVRLLLRALPPSGDALDVEVVVNDWGLLAMIRRERPDLRVVVGRLLNKMMRDPRVTPFYDQGPQPAREALASSSLSISLFQDFLRSRGVARVEFDALYQGIALDLKATGLAGSIYLPFGYVATGRICVFAALHHSKEDKFRFDIPCRHECQDWSIEQRDSRSPYEEARDLTLFRRGNTVFYPQQGDFLEQALATLDQIGIDRVVLELDLPM